MPYCSRAVLARQNAARESPQRARLVPVAAACVEGVHRLAPMQRRRSREALSSARAVSHLVPQMALCGATRGVWRGPKYDRPHGPVALSDGADRCGIRRGSAPASYVATETVGGDVHGRVCACPLAALTIRPPGKQIRPGVDTCAGYDGHKERPIGSVCFIYAPNASVLGILRIITEHRAACGSHLVCGAP